MSDVIYETLKTVSHRISKHLVYSPLSSVFGNAIKQSSSLIYYLNMVFVFFFPRLVGILLNL